MTDIILTQYDGAILGPIAKLLGWIMNGVYLFLSKMGIENIGLSIIVLTIVIYTCMLPLTIKQQKFSIMSRKMNPELQAIQKKYQGKKDQESQMKMTEETQMIYDKYGVSPTGSCLQLLIQMPILFALYRVIYNVPAYVASVKNVFTPLVEGIMATPGYAATMDSLVETLKIVIKNVDFTGSNAGNFIIDALYSMNVAGWDTLRDSFPSLTSTIGTVQDELNHLNYFLGLNISNSPLHIITTSFKAGSYLMMIGAILVPLFSYLTQVLNIKLMPQQENKDNKNQADTMAQSMKTMNMMMPFMSDWFCLTLPAGMGLYWIAGSVVRSIQQIVVNRYMDKMDFDDIIRKNEAKSAKKRKKLEENQERLNAYANMKTKNIGEKANAVSSSSSASSTRPQGEIKPGSMRDKANMVKRFNESNNNK